MDGIIFTFDNNCKKCTNWELMSGSPLLGYKAPMHYPGKVTNNDVVLNPAEITFDSLKNCISRTLQNYGDGTWTKNNVRAYCTLHGINQAGVKLLMNKSDNCAAINSLAVNTKGESNFNDSEYIIDDFERNKHKYEQWEGGPYWNANMKLNNFVDAIMHLLFLGITKATNQLIVKWIHQMKLQEMFNLKFKVMFSPIISMGLDWCKLIYSEAGWVSDNYLALARIMKWLYSNVATIQQNRLPGIDIGNIEQCLATLLSTISYVMSKEVSMNETSAKLKHEIKMFCHQFIKLINYYMIRIVLFQKKNIYLIG